MPEPRDNRFPHGLRLHGPQAFRTLYESGIRETAGPFVAVFGKAGDDSQPMRLGVSAPRKAGNAVVRNRVKRQLREAFRTLKAAHTPGVDLVVLIRAHKPLSADAVRQQVLRVLERVSVRAARGDLPRLNPGPVDPAPPTVQ